MRWEPYAGFGGRIGETRRLERAVARPGPTYWAVLEDEFELSGSWTICLSGTSTRFRCAPS